VGPQPNRLQRGSFLAVVVVRYALVEPSIARISKVGRRLQELAQARGTPHPQRRTIARFSPFCHFTPMRVLLCCLLAMSAFARGAESPAPDPPSTVVHLSLAQPAQYTGMCDASGAVAVSSNLFAVASDEDNILRLYRSDQPGRPVNQFDFNGFLEVRGKSLEADLEGAARIGTRAFWIGSHGRNKDGKERLNRHRLFATDITVNDGDFVLTPAGKPCKRLLDDLLADSKFDQFHLAEASRHAPKEPGALNIEGLSATPEGHLLIGLRNPIPAGKALLIPLLNPNEVIQGNPASFGTAVQLDLGGRGIRDIAWHGGIYLIIAGSWHGGSHFQLYRWAGPGSKPEPLCVDRLNDFHPEALIIYPQHGLQEFQVLSDDGTSLIDGCPCKDLKDPNRQVFRSYWVAQ
jgi:hypothetical protein